MKTKHSLSLYVALWLAAAIASSMAAYAGYQYATTPSLPALDLILHHSLHVLTLGAVIHLVSWLILRRLIVRPINAIYLHLYAISTGKIGRLDVNSNIKEISDIVGGINLMVANMDRAGDKPVGADGAQFYKNHNTPEKLAALKGCCRKRELRLARHQSQVHAGNHLEQLYQYENKHSKTQGESAPMFLGH